MKYLKEKNTNVETMCITLFVSIAILIVGVFCLRNPSFITDTLFPYITNEINANAEEESTTTNYENDSVLNDENPSFDNKSTEISSSETISTETMIEAETEENVSSSSSEYEDSNNYIVKTSSTYRFVNSYESLEIQLLGNKGVTFTIPDGLECPHTLIEVIIKKNEELLYDEVMIADATPNAIYDLMLQEDELSHIEIGVRFVGEGEADLSKVTNREVVVSVVDLSNLI